MWDATVKTCLLYMYLVPCVPNFCKYAHSWTNQPDIYNLTKTDMEHFFDVHGAVDDLLFAPSVSADPSLTLQCVFPTLKVSKWNMKVDTLTDHPPCHSNLDTQIT